MSSIISETNAKGKCLVLFWESLGGWVFKIILLFLRSDILLFYISFKAGFQYLVRGGGLLSVGVLFVFLMLIWANCKSLKNYS